MVQVFLLFSCRTSTIHPAGEVKDFFAQLDDSSLVKDHFMLVDSVQYDSWKQIFTTYALQDSSLARPDIDFMAAQMEVADQEVWTPDTFDSASIISKHYVDSLSKFCAAGHRPHYYIFSKPYFSRDKNYCVLFYNYYVGRNCAETSLRLYRKDRGKWLYVKSYFSIVS